MCVQVRVKKIKWRAKRAGGVLRRRREKFWGFAFIKENLMILMLGEILVTKHLSLKHCVHCNAAALAWDHAVSELCKAGRQGLIKPITWLESLLMGPIKHAPNGCQSQGVDMYSLIHDMRLPCGPHHHNLPATTDP